MAEIRTTALFVLALKGIDILPVGRAPGCDRLIGVVGGGTFDGSRVRGTVLPGGNDWIVGRRDGTWAIDVRLPLRTDDGVMIGMHYAGVRLVTSDVLERVKRGEPVDRSEFYIRMTATFETSASSYDWLNRVIGIGLGRPVSGGVVYDVFELL